MTPRRWILATLIGFGVVLGLSACAPRSVLPLSSDTNETLCYHPLSGDWTQSVVRDDDAVRAEITRRHLLKPGDKALMTAGKFKVGMSECAALSVMSGTKGRYWATQSYYRFGDDEQVIVSAPDPRVKSASDANADLADSHTFCFQFHRCYVQYYDQVRQKYVPKYLLTFKDGALEACRAVDLSKIDTTGDNAKLFPYSCSAKVPGF